MDRRKILGFAIGPVGAGLLSFVSLPIMTWIFPTEMIGELSMLQVAISLSIVLCCLGLDQAYVREYHEYYDKPSLLWNSMTPGLLILCVVLVAITLLDSHLLSSLLFAKSSASDGLIVALCLIVAYLTRFLSLILRMQDRGFAYSMSQVLSKLLLLSIVLGYALFATSRDFMMLLSAQASALLLTLLVFAWNTRRDWMPALRANMQRTLVLRLLGFGWPLVFGGIASWGLMAMDRIFLRSFSTYEQLAVYSVAASIASGVTIIAGIFNTIWAPLVYKWVADKVDMERLDSIADHMVVLVFIVVCAAGAGSWILRYVLPHAYAQVPYIVVGCMVSPLFYTLSEVTGIGIAITRRTKLSLLASLSAMLANAALCFVLIGRMGATGAMIATATSFWLFFVLRTELSAQVWRTMPRLKQHGYSLCALFLAVAFALYGGSRPVLAAAVWSAMLVAVLWFERLSVTSLCSKVLRRPQLQETNT